MKRKEIKNFEWRYHNDPPHARPDKLEDGDNVDRVSYESPKRRIESMMRAGSLLMLERMKQNIYDVKGDLDVDISELDVSPMNRHNFDALEAKRRIKIGNRVYEKLRKAKADKMIEEKKKKAADDEKTALENKNNGVEENTK